VRGIACYHQHERLHDSLANLAGIGLQLDLDALVQANPIFELDLLDRLSRFSEKFSRVTTAGSLTKPSAMALPSG